MPEPLLYATPDLNKPKPLSIDTNVLTLCVAQALVVLLAFRMISSDQDHVYDGPWLSRLARYWTSSSGFAVTHLFLTLIAIRGGVIARERRARVFRSYTLLLLANLFFQLMGLYLLELWPVRQFKPGAVPLFTWYYVARPDSYRWLILFTLLAQPVFLLLIARAAFPGRSKQAQRKSRLLASGMLMLRVRK